MDKFKSTTHSKCHTIQPAEETYINDDATPQTRMAKNMVQRVSPGAGSVKDK